MAEGWIWRGFPDIGGNSPVLTSEGLKIGAKFDRREKKTHSRTARAG